MKLALLIAAAGITSATLSFGSGAQPKSEQPSVIIWYEDWGLAPKVIGPQILVALWNNGEAMWSKNPVYGGPPYVRSRVEPKSIQDLKDSVRKKGYFSADYVMDHWGPDSWFTGIYIGDGSSNLITRSWHEVAEQNPKAVAASYGLTGLGKQSREDFLKHDDEEYQKYRRMWTDIRRMVSGVLPRRGRTVREVRVEVNHDRGIPTIESKVVVAEAPKP